MSRVPEAIVDLLNLPSFIGGESARRRASCDSQRSCTSKMSKCSESASSVASSSTDIICIEQLTDFQSVINSEVALDFFRRFLEESHCDECLNFYLDVEEFKEEYKQLNCSRMKYEKARRIYDSYLNTESGSCTTPVNVDSECRRRICGAINDYTPSAQLFDEAQREVLQMLKFDLLPRFVKAESVRKRNSGDMKENDLHSVKLHRKSFFRVLKDALTQNIGLESVPSSPKRSVASMGGDITPNEYFTKPSRKFSTDSLPLRRTNTTTPRTSNASTSEINTEERRKSRSLMHSNSFTQKHSSNYLSYSASDSSKLQDYGTTMQKLASKSKELLFRTRHSTPPYRHKVAQMECVDNCVKIATSFKDRPLNPVSNRQPSSSMLSSLLPSPLTARRNIFDTSGQQKRQLHEFVLFMNRRRSGDTLMGPTHNVDEC